MEKQELRSQIRQRRKSNAQKKKQEKKRSDRPQRGGTTLFGLTRGNDD